MALPPPPPPPPTVTAAAPLHRWRLASEPTDRMVRGIAAAIGREAGLSSTAVRAGFVVLGVAGGLGVALYLAAWVLAVDDSATPHRAAPARPLQQLGAAVGLLGALVCARALGIWFGDGVVWPLALAATGSVAAWSGRDGTARTALPRPVRPPLLRGLGGSLLVVVGLGLLLADNVGLGELRASLLALVVGAAGVLLLAGPWLGRVAGLARDERDQRLRERARSEVAAHLHDSVLQTLALIQGSQDRPARMAALARRQERELRAWLYGEPTGRGGTPTLAGAVQALVDDVEERHDVVVEPVVVGGGGWLLTDPDGPAGAVLGAVREALVNAALHAGVDRVQVYVERDGAGIEAWVRDRGRGFDPSRVDAARRGLRDSIRARVTAVGGSARITARPGAGTEVHVGVRGDAQRLGLAPVPPQRLVAP